MIFKLKQKNKGMTLLFAMIVVSIALSVGISIISTSFRQFKLSGLARDSQYAFYAANTGIECAMYWDLVGESGVSIFATSTESRQNFNLASVICVEQNFLDPSSTDCNTGLPPYPDYVFCVNKDSNYATTKFKIDNGNICVHVLVKKEEVPEGIKTTIESYGYNTCVDSPRRVERGLRVIY